MVGVQHVVTTATEYEVDTVVRFHCVVARTGEDQVGCPGQVRDAQRTEDVIEVLVFPGT